MNQFPENLHRIHSRWRRFVVSFTLSGFVLAGRLYQAVRNLRPNRLMLPATGAQVVLSLYALHFQAGQGLFRVTIGTLVIAALAMLPSTLPRQRCHWVQ
jgi:hypothetical protein